MTLLRRGPVCEIRDERVHGGLPKERPWWEEDTDSKKRVRYFVPERRPLLAYSNYRRSLGRFWAAKETVDFLDRLVKRWRTNISSLGTLPFTPSILLGDISKKGGGPLSDHKSHEEGTQIDIYYIAHDGKNVHVNRQAGKTDEAWNFHTQLNTLLLRTILECKPYRVLTQVRSLLDNAQFAQYRAIRRVDNKPRHADHFHVDVVRQAYMGKKNKAYPPDWP